MFKKSYLVFIFLSIVLIFGTLILFLPNAETIDSVTFMEKIEHEQVDLIELTTGNDEVRGEYKNGRRFYTEVPNNTSSQFLEKIKKHKVKILVDYVLQKGEK